MKRRYLLIFVFAFIFISHQHPVWASPSIAAGKYEIDPIHSKVGFEVAHLVISSVEGKFDKFSGMISSGDRPEAFQLNALIDSASVDTGFEKRDQHLRSPDFLNVKEFPILTFKSKKISWNGSAFKITGDLTIRDITKEVTLDGKFLGTVKDMSGNDKIAAQAATKINRKDFGLTWNKLVEAGPIVGEEVTISLKIEAARQPEGKK